MMSRLWVPWNSKQGALEKGQMHGEGLIDTDLPFGHRASDVQLAGSRDSVSHFGMYLDSRYDLSDYTDGV